MLSLALAINYCRNMGQKANARVFDAAGRVFSDSEARFAPERAECESHREGQAWHEAWIIGASHSCILSPTTGIRQSRLRPSLLAALIMLTCISSSCVREYLNLINIVTKLPCSTCRYFNTFADAASDKEACRREACHEQVRGTCGTPFLEMRLVLNDERVRLSRVTTKMYAARAHDS